MYGCFAASPLIGFGLPRGRLFLAFRISTFASASEVLDGVDERRQWGRGEPFFASPAHGLLRGVLVLCEKGRVMCRLGSCGYVGSLAWVTTHSRWRDPIMNDARDQRQATECLQSLRGFETSPISSPPTTSLS